MAGKTVEEPLARLQGMKLYQSGKLITKKGGAFLEVKILGSTGCSTCDRLHRIVKDVVKETGVQASVDKVTDVKEILRHGVMTAPALVVDGEVKAAGRVPSKQEITDWLRA